jgi:chromosome segregation ATPase
VDALRRRCYELEHAANALPATLEKLRELQAYTKDLASQYEAQVGDLEGQLASRTDGEHAWKMAASKADAEVEDLQRRLSSAEAEAKNTRQSMESALGEQGSDASKRERLLTQQLEEQQGQYEAELRGVRQELAQSAEWWRARVDAVRDEEEQHTEEVEEHVESLSQMLVQAEKQLQVTKTALEEASASREDLKRTVAGLERANEDLARQLESKEDSVRKLKADLEDASRTAHVFEEELRDVATKLSETDQVKGGLSKRIESYHTQEDNYRRHASDLVDFSSRAGAALAQAVKDALQSVELLNKVDDAITGNDGSHHNTSGVASGMSSSTSNFGDQSSAVSGMRSLRSAGLQQRLGEIIAGSGSLTGRGPSDIWEVASFLEARVDLAVKAMATLTSGAKSIAANTDEIKRNAGVKMLQLERNLEGALRDREGTKAAISGKDRSIGELEKKVRQLQGEKGAMGEQLRMLQAGEGTRLGDLQRMVESQAYELSSQEASLAEATRHWMNHETATENLQETTQKLISIITSALSEDPTVTDEELNGLVLIGPTDIQGLEERIFREYEHYHTATYHMLEEVVRLLCDRAHALNLSAGKTFRKLSEVTSDKNEANRKMSQARDQLDKAELRNSQLQNKRLEMGKQLGWLEAEPGQAARSGSIGPGAIAGGGSHDQQEVGRLKMRCLELESKLEQREGVGDQLESLMERLKDMATAGVSAVAAARAAKSTLKQRFGSGYEEDKQGEDEDGLANVYDELARFQENLANLEAPVASGSLEFAVLVTGFVVQTLSHELLVQDLTASGGADGHNPLLAGAGKSAVAMQAHLQQQLALFEDEAGGGGGRGSRGSAGAEGDPRIAELKAQVKVLGEQLKAQTATAQAAKAALRESELKHLTGGESSGTSAGRDMTSSSFGTGLGASGDGGDGGSSSDEQQSALRFDLERKHAALRSLQEERDRLENELSEALEKVSTMSASQEAGGDMKRLMELENKIADLEEEMENPKALSIHRASQVRKCRMIGPCLFVFPNTPFCFDAKKIFNSTTNNRRTSLSMRRRTSSRSWRTSTRRRMPRLTRVWSTASRSSPTTSPSCSTTSWPTSRATCCAWCPPSSRP